MPVRSFNTSVLKWPSRETVLDAAKQWAAEIAERCPHIVRVGCFGSAARGDWHVGSDLDLVLLVEHTDRPFLYRAAEFDTGSLPVPVDLLVYTLAEWAEMRRSGRLGGIGQTVLWLYERPAPNLGQQS